MFSRQLSDHLHQCYFGGNWTTSNLKTVLSDVSWQEATYQREGFNTISALTYHNGYYVTAILNVLKGKGLHAKDEFSFDVPNVENEADWQALQHRIFSDVEQLCVAIKLLDDNILSSHFTDEKYGTYARNLMGLIEHSHYHLGQIVILKKLLRGNERH